MSKEERDKLLIYLTEQINSNITECRVKAAKEDGKIEGMQLIATQIANYIRGLAERRENDVSTNDIR